MTPCGSLAQKSMAITVNLEFVEYMNSHSIGGLLGKSVRLEPGTENLTQDKVELELTSRCSGLRDRLEEKLLLDGRRGINRVTPTSTDCFGF